MENESIYNGKPSIVLPKRPFFSIIIACYNSGKYLTRLLNSIEDQNMNDEIEVILADDHSTESYQDIVDLYKDSLSIRQVITDYNFAPGNTREKGVSVAEGEWIIFADHDDYFVDNTLPIVKDAILEKGEKYHAIANFREVDEEGNILQHFRRTRNWCHAKFYNLDNLWKAYNIHFKLNLKTHEDICVSAQVQCAMHTINNDNPLYLDIEIYNWVANPESLSRTKYRVDKSFTETYFRQYIESTCDTYLEFYLTNRIDHDYALHSCIDCLLYLYFYINGFMFHHPEDYIRENIGYARDFYLKAKKIFNLTNKDVYNAAAVNDAQWYMAVRDSAAISAGPYVTQITLKDFLDLLDHD
jgi:glycosyltransferase involved in cell wall biosynthesis